MQSLLKELAEGRGFRPRILVVDDQPLNIRLIHELFKDECDVIMAMEGEQALLKCETQYPDLIILDVLMPDMSGHEVCRRLKAESRTCDIPVVFLTAQEEEADEMLGFALGAVDFISKPIKAPLVRARIKTHLALKLQSDLFKSIALTDGLTGIANRRRFDEHLQRDWLQCARNTEYLSLLMIDVDHFKSYNDHYGHQQGDKCLQQVARAIKSILKRPYDLAARYGGEEFACVLPNTESIGAAEIARQMLDRIRELKIEHATSQTYPFITVSIGVATQIPTAGSLPSWLVSEADIQLYRAKQRGRNRWSTADQPAEACDKLLSN
ncbi:diguanylate cyclase domain-containing protein [Pseudomonas huanghezhanensis]|uniref:diguanylate cyclase domain-containing protein n=1 Tax=Pseudomonas huanghezhanensis TaxID=3002903 RepID=UPI002285BEED|nr:diguanylate cyclase [Pseudomonas sp. BSw22131]